LRYAVLQAPFTADAAKRNYGGGGAVLLRHPACAWLGLRPALAQHTAAEHAAFRRWAAGRTNVVEIGVAEGVSAMAMREVMSEEGTLYLIDPFHLSRIPALNFTKRAAHRAVDACPRGRVVWIEKFSHDAVKGWNAPIDTILIDGDHSAEAVERDWKDWSGFVRRGGAALFHDARVFEGGWTEPDWGPVRFVDKFFRADAATGWEIVDETDSLVAVKRSE
jgi:Methyltransferase domain